MLELKDVSRSAGRDPALSLVSLQIARNVPTAVAGLSPPERTLLLRLLAGAERPQSGFIKLDGRDVAEARKQKSRIAQVGQAGVKSSGQRVGKLIGRPTAERVRLGGKMDARVSDLDLDQRLRLAIALAREEKPSLLLLNAPGAELDLGARERFVADLGTMLADTGAVVVLLAGSADEALGLGGDIVVLSKGSLVQAGAASEVFTHPVCLSAAMATSHPALNVLQMAARNGAGILSDGSSFQPPEGVALPAHGACTVAFRPDDTLFERQGAACVRFIARAAGEEIISGRRFVRLTFAGSNWLTPQPAMSLPLGAVLNVFVDRLKLMVFGAEGRVIPQPAPIAFSAAAGSSQANDSPGG